MRQRVETRRLPRTRGVSIVEIMIGLLIGMIGVLVIMQALSVFEGRKRTVGSGSDAQTVGAIALYAIKREAKFAGYGFGTAPADVFNCTLDVLPSGGYVPPPLALVPARIVKGAAPGQADELVLMYSHSVAQITPTPIRAVSGNDVVIKATGAIAKDDFVLAALPGSPGTCSLRRVNAVDAGAATITVASISPSFAVDASLFNFSRDANNLGMAANRYYVVGERLMVQDLLSGVSTEIAPGVVGMQLQYGLDAAGNDGVIDTWSATLGAASWTAVRALRLSIAVRSGQFERTKVTPTVPATSWGVDFAMNDIGGASDSDPGGADGGPNNWRNYRYQVFESVVPLVNIMWGAGA